MLIDFGPVTERAGLFCLAKKTGAQRLVVGARRSNCHFCHAGQGRIMFGGGARLPWPVRLPGRVAHRPCELEGTVGVCCQAMMVHRVVHLPHTLTVHGV